MSSPASGILRSLRPTFVRALTAATGVAVVPAFPDPEWFKVGRFPRAALFGVKCTSVDFLSDGSVSRENDPEAPAGKISEHAPLAEAKLTFSLHLYDTNETRLDTVTDRILYIMAKAETAREVLELATTLAPSFDPSPTPDPRSPTPALRPPTPDFRLQLVEFTDIYPDPAAERIFSRIFDFAVSADIEDVSFIDPTTLEFGLDVSPTVELS